MLVHNLSRANLVGPDALHKNFSDVRYPIFFSYDLPAAQHYSFAVKNSAVHIKDYRNIRLFHPLPPCPSLF